MQLKLWEKIPMNVTELGIDLMSFSAHKIYGPKGVGALYMRSKDPKVQINPLIYGGGQERGLRSGTLNVPGIVGFGVAAELCEKNLAAESLRLLELREFFLGSTARSYSWRSFEWSSFRKSR